jgi:hypothetical protein
MRWASNSPSTLTQPTGLCRVSRPLIVAQAPSVTYGDSSPPSSGTSAVFTGSPAKEGANMPSQSAKLTAPPKGEPSLRTTLPRGTCYLASPLRGVRSHAVRLKVATPQALTDEGKQPPPPSPPPKAIG